MPRPKAPIPEPPRSVRWSACLARHWTAGVGGVMALALATVLGVTAVLAAGALPFRDIILDAGAEEAIGQIDSVAAIDQTLAGPLWRIDYRFRQAGHERQGRSFARRPPETDGFAPGAPCPVRFQKQRPEIHRIAGTRLAVYPDWVTLTTSSLALFGVLGIYGFGRAALRLRIGLREGQETSAQLIEVRSRPRWLTAAVWIHYRFYDHLGNAQICSHWTRSGSALGTQLRTEHPRSIEVIFDPRNPTANRLVTGTEFDRVS